MSEWELSQEDLDSLKNIAKKDCVAKGEPDLYVNHVCYVAAKKLEECDGQKDIYELRIDGGLIKRWSNHELTQALEEYRFSVRDNPGCHVTLGLVATTIIANNQS